MLEAGCFTFRGSVWVCSQDSDLSGGKWKDLGLVVQSRETEGRSEGELSEERLSVRILLLFFLTTNVEGSSPLCHDLSEHILWRPPGVCLMINEDISYPSLLCRGRE